MLTDGVQSYAMFNYEQLMWTAGFYSSGDTQTGLTSVDGNAAVVSAHEDIFNACFEITVDCLVMQINLFNGSSASVVCNLAPHTTEPVPSPEKRRVGVMKGIRP